MALLQPKASFSSLELTNAILKIYAETKTVHPGGQRKLAEVFWELGESVYPDADTRHDKIDEARGDFMDILHDFTDDPRMRLSTARAKLRELLERNGAAYICLVASLAFLVDSNCHYILALVVQSPQLWLDILTSPDADVYVT